MKTEAEVRVFLVLPAPSRSAEDPTIHIEQQGEDRQAVLRWSAVREDTAGNPIVVDEYRVFTQFSDDGNELWTFVAATQDTTFACLMPSDMTDRRFFRIVAYRGSQGFLSRTGPPTPALTPVVSGSQSCQERQPPIR